MTGFRRAPISHTIAENSPPIPAPESAAWLPLCLQLLFEEASRFFPASGLQSRPPQASAPPLLRSRWTHFLPCDCLCMSGIDHIMNPALKLLWFGSTASQLKDTQRPCSLPIGVTLTVRNLLPSGVPASVPGVGAGHRIWLQPLPNSPGQLP